MSVAAIATAVFHTARVSVPTIFEGLAGRIDIEVCNRRLASWAKALVEQAQIRIEVVGAEHAEPGESFVVMSNHRSLYDIPVLFEALGRPLRMVAKKELFKIPLMGGAMHASGFVEVDRGNRARAVASLAAARVRLQQGISIWIAPEGTRSETGELGPFKRGGFHLALGTGTRILVTLVGTENVLVARGWRVQRGATVKATLSSPIDPKDFGQGRRAELMQAVREAIERHLGSGGLTA